MCPSHDDTLLNGITGRIITHNINYVRLLSDAFSMAAKQIALFKVFIPRVQTRIGIREMTHTSHICYIGTVYLLFFLSLLSL